MRLEKRMGGCVLQCHVGNVQMFGSLDVILRAVGFKGSAGCAFDCVCNMIRYVFWKFIWLLCRE